MKAGATAALGFNDVSWSSHSVYTLISGKSFNVSIGGSLSGTYISDNIEVYSTECSGVFYTSQACQQAPGTIIQCDGLIAPLGLGSIYTTAEAIDPVSGQPTGVQIYKLTSAQYAAAGSPAPNLIIDTCTEIIQACPNTPPSPCLLYTSPSPRD